MATLNKVLIESKEMEAAQTTQYTAPATTTTATKAIIDTFTATNTTASTATITVNLVEVSDTVGSDNSIVYQKLIDAGKTDNFPELIGHILEAGGFISTTGTGSALTIRCSGREVT